MRKKITRLAGIVCFSGVLCLTQHGCAPRPAGEIAVPVETPDAFSRSGQAVLPGKWWQSFDDAVLDALIEEGLAQNFSIRSAWDRLRQAEQVAAKAGASLLPTVDYQGAARRRRQDANDTVVYSTNYEAGLAAAYEVDLWGRVQSVEQAAILDARAAEHEVAAAAITLSAAIGRTWYQWVESQLQERLIDEQVDTNKQTLEIITLQFRQGQIRAADVFRQRQLVEATQGQLIVAQERSALLRHQLAILLGKTPGQWQPQQAQRLVDPAQLPDTGLPVEMLGRRPDLQSARAAIAAADRRVYSAIADQYPRIRLTASAETGGGRVGDLFDDWAGMLAASVAGPLFDGNLRRAEVERTRAVLSERINTYAQRTLEAIADVEDALQQEYYQRQTIASLREQLKQAEQVSDRIRQSYLKGQVDYLRVLDAQVSRQTLQRNELTARRVLIERRIDLCRSIAGDWQMTRPEPATLVYKEKQ